ncbi:hypothetical protein ACFQHO_43945 [Actinomadura yumaensis]|uniref:hypothetical protein n=1 Tax=Actinomadura yumaensis TaxID=111807 RepID=UPI00361E2210
MPVAASRTLARRRVGHRRAHRAGLLQELGEVVARRGLGLGEERDQLGRDALAEGVGGAPHHPCGVGDHLTGTGIDDEVLFLDAESEGHPTTSG